MDLVNRLGERSVKPAASVAHHSAAWFFRRTTAVRIGMVAGGRSRLGASPRRVGRGRWPGHTARHVARTYRITGLGSRCRACHGSGDDRRPRMREGRGAM